MKAKTNLIKRWKEKHFQQLAHAIFL